MTWERVPEPIVVVVIGRDAIVGRALELLLRSSDSSVRFLTEPLVEELESLDDAHILLLAPCLDSERRESFLTLVGASPALSAVPVLELGADEERVARKTTSTVRFVPWPCRAEELQRQIKVALKTRRTDKAV